MARRSKNQPAHSGENGVPHEASTPQPYDRQAFLDMMVGRLKHLKVVKMLESLPTEEWIRERLAEEIDGPATIGREITRPLGGNALNVVADGPWDDTTQGLLEQWLEQNAPQNGTQSPRLPDEDRA